ncbi:hypothetical protein [Catellatospora sp. NPDC049609]|uniref:golvesin C-terminal-like domain-containing protein n=1 Tax=Catellatospora sp. NPDC049609 TaxID=3155505 RepID=UPI003423056F
MALAVALMATGSAAASVTAQDDPPAPPNYNACYGDGNGFWWSTGITDYRVDSDFRYYKFHNCRNPWEPQETYGAFVRYIDNPDNDGNYDVRILNFCLGPRTVLDLGGQSIISGRISDGALLSFTTPLVSACDPSQNPPVPGQPPAPPPPPGDGPTPPPEVEVSGGVNAPINGKINQANPEHEHRPLSGARIELWYLGRAGVDTPQQWRPVLSGRDDNNRPDGTPVSGYLDDDGRYTLSFIYPQTYTLRDGTMWEGCYLSQAAPSFMSSKACNDGDLELRVYPRNADGSVMVTDRAHPVDVPLVAHRVPLGRFFERPTEAEESVANSEHALAYRGVLNARTIWPGLATYPDVKAVVDDRPGGAVGSHTSFRVNRALAGTSAVEHEVIHLVTSHVYGYDPDGIACAPHTFTKPCGSPPNSVSAWWEGVADFLAVVAEHPNYDDPRFLLRAGRTLNLEDCVEGVALKCKAGSAVEGNIAGILWDLIDAHVDFDTKRGLADDRTVPLAEVLDVVVRHTPETADEYFVQWRNEHPDVNFEEVFFLNQLRVAQFVDASVDTASGDWASVDCEPCAGGRFLLSTGPGNRYSWDINRGVQSGGTGLYDIWVRLPVRSEGGRLTEYRVVTAEGVKTVVVDQTISEGGWIRLDGGTGFRLRAGQHNIVTIVNGTQEPNAALFADALIVSPRSE